MYMRNFIALWCNGSTTDFGSVSHGSSPCRVTSEIRNIVYFVIDDG